MLIVGMQRGQEDKGCCTGILVGSTMGCALVYCYGCINER